MKQYEIWWANLAPPVGRRPVLLLSRDHAYTFLNSVLTVEITTTIRGIPQEVPLGRKEGLPQKCVANFDNLRPLRRDLLAARIGALRQSQIQEVKRALGSALGWPELTVLD